MIALLTLIMLAGCISEKRKRHRAEDFYRLHPDELALKCADKFVVQKEYVKGETVTEESVIHVPADSVVCPPSEKIAKVKCPDAKIIKVSSIRVDTLRLPNPAKERALASENNQLQVKYAVLDAKRKDIEAVARDRLKLLLLFVAITAFLIFMRIKGI